MKQPQSITSMPESPDAERHRREVQYLVAMGIRLVCVLMCFFVQGWWLVLPILGALILPYVAVVLANVKSRHDGEEIARPGSILPVSKPVPRDEEQE